MPSFLVSYKMTPGYNGQEYRDVNRSRKIGQLRELLFGDLVPPAEQVTGF